MSSIVQTGLQGIQRGLENAAKDAERLTRAYTPGSEDDTETVDASIDLKQDLRQVQASRKVVQVGDKLGQEILDILA